MDHSLHVSFHLAQRSLGLASRSYIDRDTCLSGNFLFAPLFHQGCIDTAVAETRTVLPLRPKLVEVFDS